MGAYMIRFVPVSEGELEALLDLIYQLDGVVKDFLPNIGKCALQDYQALNIGLCEATRVLIKYGRTPKKGR